MLIKIKITKKILERSMMCGTEENYKNLSSAVGQNCAIGKAIFDLFGNNSWVDENFILIYKNGINLNEDFRMIDSTPDFRIVLSKRVCDFIIEFDNNTPQERLLMQPFDFNINVPNELIDMIGIGQVYKILSESKTLEHVNV